MTEKRFKPKRHCKDGKCHNLILDKSNYRFVLMLSSWEDCKDVTDVLNELADENEQLKQEVDMLSCELSVSANKTISKDCRIQELVKENEQLKQQEKRLYKYFRKCFDNVSEQGFQETWEVVKKYD